MSQSRSQSPCSPYQRLENESYGSNHFEVSKEITEFCPSGLLRSLHLWRMPEMVTPRALVLRPLVKGNEDFGNEIESEQSSIQIEM